MTDENEAKEENGESEDAGEGDKQSTTPLIDDANIAAKRMEEANKEKKELLDREEKLMSIRAIGGETEAGGTKEEVKEETPKEYNDRIEKELSEGQHGD